MNYPAPSDPVQLSTRLSQACEYHQEGQLDRALKLYLELHQELCLPQLSYNIGLIYYEQEDYSAALTHFTLAHEAVPDDMDTLFNLALCQKECGHLEKAITSYRLILDQHPSDVDTRYNLAGCLKDSHRNEEAIIAYGEVLNLCPNHLSALNNLAYMYHLTGNRDGAIRCFQELLEQDPEREGARFMLAALQGETEQRPPESHVRALFDNYSKSFDESLLEQLHYSVPQILRELVVATVDPQCGFSLALDLGCGTGLGGKAFADLVDYMDGIDLSAKMLDRAREKNIYRNLVTADLLSFLRDNEVLYDMILAADVFGYLGNLEETFAAVFSSAREGTIFCFSTEDGTGEDYLLLSSGRYAHSKTYIAKTAAKNGWKVLATRQGNLRKEGNDWVTGTFWVLRKAEA